MKTKFSSVAGWALAIIVAVAVLSSFRTFVRETEKIKEVENKNSVQNGASRIADALRCKELCQDNLKLLTGAKATFSVNSSNFIHDGIPTTEELRDVLKVFFEKDMDELICLGGGTYFIGAYTNAPTCSVLGHTLP